jgi:hypothetical protein
MARQTVEQRLATLEAEVAQLRSRLEKLDTPKRSNLDAIWGKFANDPVYEEAMRLGREWRESARPKARGKKKA